MTGKRRAGTVLDVDGRCADFKKVTAPSTNWSLLGSIAFFVASLAASWASDWPQHLGPGRNAVSPEAGFKPQGKVLWSKDVGQGFAAPVVAQGKLFLFHRLGNEEVCEALDALTGKPLWKTAYATAYRDDFGFDEGPRAAPAVNGGRVFLHGAEGTLTALDAASGKRLWSVDTMRTFKVQKQYFGQASAPIVLDDKVLLQVGGPAGAGIIAFDAATGKVIWKAIHHESGYASPTPLSPNETLFFTRFGLASIRNRDGIVRFEQRWRALSNTSVNAATPVVKGTQVFVTASYGAGAALFDTATVPPRQVWSNDDSLSAHYATPVLYSDHLYGYHGRQETGAVLRCIEWSTGKVNWTKEGFGAGSILRAGSTLIVVKENGTLLTAEGNPKDFRPSTESKVLDGTVRAYPAFSNSTLYLRNERKLVAVQ